MTDPIADMLTRMRNALAVKKREVVLPHSNIKLGIAELLKRCGYIEGCEVVKNTFDEIVVTLKYTDGRPQMRHLKRISKPGCRIYAGKDELPHILNGLGTAIISTSDGLMTLQEARQKGRGGEILCEIW